MSRRHEIATDIRPTLMDEMGVYPVRVSYITGSGSDQRNLGGLF